MKVRARILRVAAQKFIKYGFYKVSMDTIVKELKTSKSSVYNHFSSKDDLVKAVLDELNNQINSSLASILSDDNLDFKGKLLAISEFTGDLLSKISEDFLSDLELYTPDLWEYYQKGRKERINNYYRKLFETGVVEGHIKKGLKIEIILSTYMLLTELPLRTEFQENLAMDRTSIYKETTDIFLKGILQK